MTDRTPDVNDLLKPHSVHLLGETHFSIDRLDDFLKEAYQLNARTRSLISYLRQIRKPYLSTAPAPRRRLHHNATKPEDIYLTDRDRDEIDSNTKSLLRDLHAGLSQLKSAETTRIQTENAVSSKKRWRAGGGILGSWASGGSAGEVSPAEASEDARRETVKLHREAVIWFLERGLEEAGLVQGEMMEVRVRREVERGKSILGKGSGGLSGGPVPVWEDTYLETGSGIDGRGGAKGLSVPLEELERNGAHDDDHNDQQLQMLKRENDNMLKHYNNKLDQVKKTEKSLLEISELQSQLSINLSTQSAQIEQLISDSMSTEENVGTGNKELKKATQRKSTAKMVFWATVGVCSFFVVWDAII